jgi:membrane protein YdbS with pleckstrin-like domain
MSSGNLSSDIIWEGSPWVTPGLVALTAEAALVAVPLSYVELALNVTFPILGATLLLVASLWLVAVGRLEFLARSTRYALRRSSLEVEHGIVRKRFFTISAAGFSDLEMSRGLAGRILNTGDIVIETDSHRDIPLVKVRDPVRVSTMIRQMMTVPLVRVEGQGSAMPR